MNKLSIHLMVVLFTAILFVDGKNPVIGQDYSITMLGNSITQGKNTGSPEVYSYRYRLWTKLLDAGADFDFVGTMVDTENDEGFSNPVWPDHLGQSFDQDHEGHGGWQAQQLRDTLPRFLTFYTPDIALIHAGSNDMFQLQNVDQTISEIEDIIQIYRNANPYIAIFLAQIIPVDESITGYENDSIIELNSKIPGIATDLADVRSPIHIVDCYTPMVLAEDYIVDGIHPDASGEEKIAQAFRDALVANQPTKPHRWTGATSTDWNTTSNWNLGTVPSPTSNVIILETATNWPTYDGNLRLGTEIGTLSMDGASELTVTGNFVIQPGNSFICRGDAVLNLWGDWTYDGTYYGGGKIDRSPAWMGPPPGGNWTGNPGYLVFDCSEAFNLAGATVFGNENEGATPGLRTFYWATSDGTEMESTTVLIEKGENRIDLDFTITTGTDHRLGVYEQPVGSIELWRDKDLDTEFPYPYPIGGVGSITTTSFNFSGQNKNYYMFFYDISYFPSNDNEENPGFAAGNTTVNFLGSDVSRMSGSPGYTGGGKIDKEVDPGDGIFTGNAHFNSQRLTFDCQAPFTLVSVKVYTNGTAGEKTFYWKTSDGTLQEETTVWVDSDENGTRIDLNFHITPGTGHYMGTSSSGQPRLWKDVYALVENKRFDYSYPLGSVGIVKSSTNSHVDYEYHYFYDFEVASSFKNINVAKTDAAVTTAGDIDIAGDMTVQSEAWLSNNNGNVLNVGGELALLADATGMASFVDKGTLSAGNARVEQYLTDTRWHYVSSPLSDAQSGVYTGVYLKSFNEATYDWTYITATTDPLVVMAGYAAWFYTNPFTASFVGSINSGSQSIPVTRTSNGQTYEGYNLVGNPYASALDWDADPGWSKTNIDNTIYFYEGDGAGGLGNYKYYVGDGGSLPGVGIGGDQEILSGIIPSMQGFFIRASANGSLAVTSDAQLHSSQAYYKQSKSGVAPQIRLFASDLNNLKDETVIRFYEEATPEHDGQYDAFKLFGYLYPQLYSITQENTNLAINTLPGYEDGTIVPLGFTSPETGEYSITLSEFVNFEPDMELFLEDNLTGEIHQLSDNPTYPFVSSPEDDPNRFMLYFTEMTEVDELIESNVYIYSYDNNIMIKLPENSEGAVVRVYDLMGKEVYSGNISGNSKAVISLTSRAGHYVVKVQTNDSMYTEKVFIK